MTVATRSRLVWGRVHYAWVIAAVTFLVIVITAGVRAAPGVLIVPLEEEFHWSRATISFAVGVNLLLYGAIGPFAAALMDRFGVRRVMTLAVALTAAAVAVSPMMHALLAADPAVGRRRRHLLRIYRRLSRGLYRRALVPVAAGSGHRHPDRRQRRGATRLSAVDGGACHRLWLAVMSLVLAGIGRSCWCRCCAWMREGPAESGLPPTANVMVRSSAAARRNPFARRFQALGRGRGRAISG